MSIRTYKQENDLCLLKMDSGYYFIGCIDLPQNGWTIEQYNDWDYKSTVNLIALNTNFIPQQIRHCSLEIVETQSGICDYWQSHYGTDGKGKAGDFRILLADLLACSDNSYSSIFYKYFEKFYQVF